ncbi:sugar lactone lactonase YvrE [Streptomyces sp. PvR006]|uniref:SMP-30/gluconolactonase/LRE family protein n=1 Tax=Streptomyces sp. PvR006 TaxID=2817860 RepID=UPI001AE65E43|nr:SMP-30/gluconolactonase/LRE family protein [Streptomyces sp. PvR006]MBP2586177.1 sugar lactone lactonase YvrE [Streptomyces sp. PvR006]
MHRTTALPCAPAPGRLSEGPVWDHRSQELLWVDITAGLVHRGILTQRGDDSDLPDIAVRDSLDLGVTVGAVLPSWNGALLAAADTSILDVGPEGIATIATLPNGTDHVRRRFNDAACDPLGRLFAGTMALSADPGAGTLYRLDRTGLTPVVDPVTISNGLGWSPDGRLLYYADSPTRRVDVYDYDLLTGTPSNRRPFARLDRGVPDGLTVDARGNVWVAVWGAGEVRAFAPDGALLTVIEVPTSHVSNCVFAGPALDVLVITTAREELAPDQLRTQRDAGRLFVCRPGAVGQTPHLYEDLTTEHAP